jgi:hypothetical protein
VYTVYTNQPCSAEWIPTMFGWMDYKWHAKSHAQVFIAISSYTVMDSFRYSQKK